MVVVESSSNKLDSYLHNRLYMLFCIITPKDVCFHFDFWFGLHILKFLSFYFHLFTAGYSRITVSRRFEWRSLCWVKGGKRWLLPWHTAIYISPQASEKVSCHCFCPCRWRGMSDMRIQNCFMSNANFLRILAIQNFCTHIKQYIVMSGRGGDAGGVTLSQKAAKSATKFQEL